MRAGRRWKPCRVPTTPLPPLPHAPTAPPQVLVARLIDRPIRPMVQPGWTRSTQLLTWVLSYDGQHSPEPLAITAAGAALAISDVPLRRAVAGARVALLPDRGFVVNPTVEEQAGAGWGLFCWWGGWGGRLAGWLGSWLAGWAAAPPRWVPDC